jgi:hypothetical protein
MKEVAFLSGALQKRRRLYIGRALLPNLQLGAHVTRLAAPEILERNGARLMTAPWDESDDSHTCWSTDETRCIMAQEWREVL